MVSSSMIDIAGMVSQNLDAPDIWHRVLALSVQIGASDIHLLAQSPGYDVAIRHDGELRVQGALSHELGKRLQSHVESVAGMDIAERRKPLEGRLREDIHERPIDLRISIVPTLHGNDMVCRLFDEATALKELADLSIPDEQFNEIIDMIARPHGLILVTGPTGSGKTTTLYAMLRQLSGRGRKIMTIEDPIEYDLKGANQLQVNSKLDVTFASLLTAVLRQDPDIIMIGEIRDEQTASTAVRAANTGHLVLATTHANRASQSIETLQSLGVHPYFLANSFRGAIAQVLVKRICASCKTALPETASMFLDDAVSRRLDGIEPKLHLGKGCDVCRNSGYSGRLGLFECVLPNEEVRQLILESKPAYMIDDAMTRIDNLSLAQSGKLAALRGDTTVEELVRVIPSI